MSWSKRVIEWSFYTLFFLVPLIFLPNTSELFEFNKIILTYLLTSVIVTAWLARMIIEKRWIFRRTSLDIPLLLFLVISLLSLVFSIDVHTSIYGYYSRWNGGLISLISYSLLYWAFVSNMDNKNAMLSAKCLVLGATPVALWGVAEHFGVDAHLWVQDVQTRVFSTLGQPNWLAAYLVALIWIPISASISKSEFLITKQIQKSQIINIAIFLLLFVTLLFTKSRSGILAFGISAGIFSLLSLKSIKKLLPVGLMILLFIFAIPNPFRDLAFKSSTPAPQGPALEVGGTESGEIRKIVWTGALRIWQASTKNLLIGTGPETFAMAYYQHRPIEHNQTSEWELLYNKAHNEFLNQLATTGILGTVSYLLLLITMFWIFVFNIKRLKTNDKLDISHQSLVIALFAGWLTIPITNFWGFSVVMVQLLMFLLPAIAIALSTQHEAHSPKRLETPQKILLILLLCATSYVLLAIGRYWQADTLLASGQKHIKYFQETQNPQFLVSAQENIVEAYKLNKGEPVIASELSNAAAYLSLAAMQQSTASAQQLAQISVAASDQALAKSPRHPNYYKSRARSFILLSDLDPQYLLLADQTLEKAMVISPTDPRLPFNLGVVHKYLGNTEKARQYFEASLMLKPDFADPKKQLDELKVPVK